MRTGERYSGPRPDCCSFSQPRRCVWGSLIIVFILSPHTRPRGALSLVVAQIDGSHNGLPAGMDMDVFDRAVLGV
jgi:hypothetical protein